MAPARAAAAAAASTATRGQQQQVQQAPDPAPMHTADRIISALRKEGYATIDVKGPRAEAIRCVGRGLASRSLHDMACASAGGPSSSVMHGASAFLSLIIQPQLLDLDLETQGRACGGRRVLQQPYLPRLGGRRSLCGFL